MNKFRLVSNFNPDGDQPQAIESLVNGINSNAKNQILLGVTGSGKTFTMANVICKLNRPALVISHNKTLAAQLTSEFKNFFPDNAVEYFVSYYDYYQPEAYIPTTDTYIEKDAQINDEIDRLRHSTTKSLLSRRDVIVVASVSCIYGLGTPDDYLKANIKISVDESLDRDELLMRLIGIKYERNDLELKRGKFRVRGDIVEIFPAYEETIYKIEFYDSEVKKIINIHPVSGEVLGVLNEITIFPATHYIFFGRDREDAFKDIEKELEDRLYILKKQNKLVEAKRLEQRTKYDLDMIREIGYCTGIENYSRHLSGRKEGEPPGVLLDYFDDDFIIFADESHVLIPQLKSMYKGDLSRKETLIEHGFRLPSAKDNRPLTFEEFEKKLKQIIYVSATPGPYELKKCDVTDIRLDSLGKVIKENPLIVDQVIRPTGLVDPMIVIKPSKGQIDDLLEEIRKVKERNERVLITTLTKKMAEDLTEYLSEFGIKVNYLHSDIETLDRIDILHDLRTGKFDVLVGINLLREGLDLPEVSLVAILDADKQGFLRHETALIQTIGRAARNINGKVILYADQITDSIKGALKETERRRKKQIDYNKKNKITPKTISKEVKDIRSESRKEISVMPDLEKYIKPQDLPRIIGELEREMKDAADNLEFEVAAVIRDKIEALKMN